VSQRTDEQLIELVQQGQTGALDELYARYAAKLYAFCFYTMRARCQEDAEDLVQDVFVRVIRSAHTFNPRRASFRTWLFRIARNHCIDRMRRSKKVKVLPIGARAQQNAPDEEASPEEAIADEREGVEETVSRTVLMEALRDCIQELERENERQALLLYYMGGKVYREIAAMLGRSIGTARNWIQSARDQVRRCLEGKGIHSPA
jgi:RNA polymerase sigma-70 factor (ECF subfamily)